jgi:hypothetical protein
MPPEPKLTVSVRLIPAVYTSVRVNIVQGEPASIVTITRVDIQHPHPFDEHGHLTAECRSFITAAVRSAIVTDGHDRHINWPPEPSRPS